MALARVISIVYLALRGTQREQCTFKDCVLQFTLTVTSAIEGVLAKLQTLRCVLTP